MRGSALTTIHPPLHDDPNPPILTRHMGRLASLFLGAFICAAFAACGGATDTPLLDDAGQPQDDATAQDTGSGKDAGNPDKDVTTQDVDVQDVVTVDVPIKPADSQIHCGTTSCSAQTQVCCATFGTTTTFKCVSSLNDCTGAQDVPLTCSSQENCNSQGLSGDICCASGQGPFNENPTCQNYSVAAQVQCQATCDQNAGEFEVGCNVQTQNCTDNTATCINSKCTLPGLTICQ